jgi:sugar phosphate isomerase/epimerase
MKRRTFLQSTATAAAAAAIGSPRQSLSAAARDGGSYEFCFFTKHLQGLEFDQIADIAAEMGVAGIEAPVRPGGHVVPERVEEDLPKLCGALKQRGLNLSILTSGINEVSDEQRTEAVLRTAASCGVKRFRMMYYKYDLDKPIWPQLQAVRPKIRDLVQLCEQIGIQPLFQNHAGKTYFGAPVWDIYSIMRDYRPEQFSFAFDIRHATMEGQQSWPLEAALVGDHMGAVYFKDYAWEGRKSINCPLGEGAVEREFANFLVKRGYTGPVSLHVEYLTGDPRDKDNLKSFIKAQDRDFATLKEWLGVA